MFGQNHAHCFSIFVLSEANQLLAGVSYTEQTLSKFKMSKNNVKMSIIKKKSKLQLHCDFHYRSAVICLPLGLFLVKWRLATVFGYTTCP